MNKTMKQSEKIGIAPGLFQAWFRVGQAKPQMTPTWANFGLETTKSVASIFVSRQLLKKYSNKTCYIEKQHIFPMQQTTQLSRVFRTFSKIIWVFEDGSTPARLLETFEHHIWI